MAYEINHPITHINHPITHSSISD